MTNLSTIECENEVLRDRLVKIKMAAYALIGLIEDGESDPLNDAIANLKKSIEMTAIIRETGESVQGQPWDDGRFHAEDGTARSWWQCEVEIIET